MSDNHPTFPGTGGGFPTGPAGGGAFPAQGMPAAGPGFPQAGPPVGGPSPRAGAAAAPAGRSRPGKSSRSEKSKGNKDTADKPVTKRLVSRQVLFAGIFALLAGGAVVWYLGGSGGTQYVVRSASDIAAGTPISRELLEAAELPADALEPDSFTADSAEGALDKAMEELDGVVSQYPLAKKSQLREGQFGLQATLGAEMDPSERLVSIQASVGTSVAGALSAGDRVDIIGAADGLTRVVAYNVPIMSITVSEEQYNSVADQQSADKDVKAGDILPGNPVPGIYVLKLPAAAVPGVLNWNESATLYLSYRAPNSIDVEMSDSTLGDSIPESFLSVPE